MFAYCNNNPVSSVDPTGQWPGISNKLTPNAMTYMSGRFYSGTSDKEREAEEEEKRKRQAYNPFNTDETVVTEAKYFSFYKGTAVIKIPAMGDSAFSCGVILMGSDVDQSNLVRHEYGHILQLKQLGLADYWLGVAAPSIFCFWKMQEDPLLHSIYYSLPWEYKANELGNATGTYAPWEDEASDAYWTGLKIWSFFS